MSPFSIKWGEGVPGHSKGVVGYLKRGEHTVCSIHTWVFSSCACYSLQNFPWNTRLSSEEVEQMFTLLCEETPPSGWIPEEIYFLLSSSQKEYGWAKTLIAHPNAKQIDTFKNKAHGQNPVFLYRYSKANDFPKELL